MRKRIFYSEAAYVIGLWLIALGAAFMAKADFGLSMVVAPAYLVYLKVSQTVPFFTFGMAEYLFQAALLFLMIAVLRRFKVSYLFSFATAVLYGFMLDGNIWLLSAIPGSVFAIRLLCYAAGLLCCAAGVSLVFHTYLSPEVYELIVKEVSGRYHWDINKVKTCYDCVSCLAGILMSFAFFGLWHFEGVKIGTVVCAPVNGFLIGRFTGLFERHWEFKDGFRWRGFFEK